MWMISSERPLRSMAQLWGSEARISNKAWFMARCGRACMELDAMDSNELRRRVEVAIRQYINWPA